MLRHKLLSASAAVPPVFIEDVFSTYLYTGNGSTQTITNGIDLAGEGGLVWIKKRAGGVNLTHHLLSDTNRGIRNYLLSSLANAQDNIEPNAHIASVSSTGFALGTTGSDSSNYTNATYASWTFRKAPRFFDVVTYTGTGANRTIAHDLGVVPGCIIIKETSAARSWYVYHRSTGNTKYLYLNLTDAAATSSLAFNNTDPTATEFTVGTINGINNSGASYVAYLFAHDPLGPSGDGSDGLIACGACSGETGSNRDIDLGWEPQWVLTKAADTIGDWRIVDNMRGFLASGTGVRLAANTSNAEASDDTIHVRSTGFYVNGLPGSGDYIYIAIRRGPMREPTSGTEVFATDTTPVNATASTPTFTAGFPVDLGIRKKRNGSDGVSYSGTRLLGDTFLEMSATSAETANSFLRTNGYQDGFGFYNGSGESSIGWMFRRAPGFFDVVAYTGAGSSGRQKTHNLGVAPELLIVKSRSNIQAWSVLCTLNGGLQGRLNETTALSSPSAAVWGDGTSYVPPTDSIFTVGTDNETNATGWTYIAYLFATLPGISKVGSYTGNGSSQTINCGFTGGARLVLIKRTDSTGDWYVWDTARGIVAGNDPHLSLNTTAAEVTTNDSIDPDSSGFIVNQLAATNINVSSATYIYLAIA